jgi:hypothetical protein
LLSCSEKPAGEVHVEKLESGGFGYRIIIQNKMFISQDNIPAINQNLPFKTSEEAALVGQLVLQKLQKHPDRFPDVSLYELDSLNISH